MFFCFFTRSGNEDPGVYGWAVVTKVAKRTNKVQFRALPPSDYLKVDPLWNDVVEQVVERVRGKVKQGTMWRVPRTDFSVLRDQIRRHAGRSA